MYLYYYFSKNNAAVVVIDSCDVYSELLKLVDNKDLLIEFAKNAVKSGIENHDPEKTQEIFDKTISNLL